MTLAERVPADALRLQESEVAAVHWLPAPDLEARLRSGDPEHVPMAADSTVRCSKLGLWQTQMSPAAISSLHAQQAGRSVC